MPQRQIATKRLMLWFLFALVTLSSCQGSKFKTGLTQKTTIHAVKSKIKLQALFLDLFSYLAGNGSNIDAIGPATSETAMGSVVSRDFIGTNVQVKGVDEADIIKTDGDEIYYASRQVLRVYEVLPSYEISLKHELSFTNMSVSGLYLLDDYLVLLGERYNDPYGYSGEVALNYFHNGSSVIQVYERHKMRVVYEVESSARFIDHRLIDRSLFIVANQNINIEEEELRPVYQENGGKEKYLSYNDIYYFDNTENVAMTVMSGLYLAADPSEMKYTSAAYLGAGRANKNIYVSNENLYIADSNYFSQKNESFNTLTLSQYKLNISDATTNYVAATIVRGGALNQFSMDEHKGYLRLATTELHRTWRENDGIVATTAAENKITNYLFILQVNVEKQNFALVASISEKLGKPNETIKAVRFNGDYAYIVTFLQRDPVYIINLEDATNPVVTDEIELPGFDVYQHPWGNNKLLGFGYAADDLGITTGLKLTAYDTTEGEARELETKLLTSEEEKDDIFWTNYRSEALINHKAILVSPEHGLFGIPYNTSVLVQEGSDYRFTYENNYYLFTIDFANNPIISEPLIISHSTTKTYNDGVNRALYIDNYLYTFSANAVVVYSLTAHEILSTLIYD